MNLKNTLGAIITGLVILTSTVSCSVAPDQQTVGEYIDDATITTQSGVHMLDEPDVAGTSINVETLNGTAILSGFAISNTEKASTESIANRVNVVIAVRNQKVVRL